MTLAEHVHVGPVATLDRVGQAWSSTGLGARIGTAAGVAASVVVSGGRVLVALTGVLMVAAALVDVREHRLPNALVGAATATGAGIDSSTVQSWLHPPAPGNVTPIRSAIDIDSAALLDRLPPAGAASVDDPIRSLDALMLNIDSAGLEPAQ